MNASTANACVFYSINAVLQFYLQIKCSFAVLFGMAFLSLYLCITFKRKAKQFGFTWLSARKRQKWGKLPNRHREPRNLKQNNNELTKCH